MELGVNIDHIATLRQARGTNYPDPIEAAVVAEANGADLITVHLREDRRHIQLVDVQQLRSVIATRLNLEMAVNIEMLAIAKAILPNDVCLVPEKREELTTEGGLNVVDDINRLHPFVKELRDSGIRVSLFIDPCPDQIEASKIVGADCIELHTGAYANASDQGLIEQEIDRLIKAVELATDDNIRVNAGHGLNYENVVSISKIQGIMELNIGHSIVARSVMCGLGQAVSEMKKLVCGYD